MPWLDVCQKVCPLMQRNTSQAVRTHPLHCGGFLFSVPCKDRHCADLRNLGRESYGGWRVAQWWGGGVVESHQMFPSSWECTNMAQACLKVILSVGELMLRKMECHSEWDGWQIWIGAERREIFTCECILVQQSLPKIASKITSCETAVSCTVFKQKTQPMFAN